MRSERRVLEKTRKLSEGEPLDEKRKLSEGEALDEKRMERIGDEWKEALDEKNRKNLWIFLIDIEILLFFPFFSLHLPSIVLSILLLSFPFSPHPKLLSSICVQGDISKSPHVAIRRSYLEILSWSSFLYFSSR